MSFLSDLYDGKTPTLAAVAAALTDLEAQLSAASSRVASATAALGTVADMSDAEHAAAEAELAAARRAEARLRAQIEHLGSLREQAATDEAAARAQAEATALRARAAAAQKRVDTEHMPLIERYEAKAREVVEIAEALKAIEMEVEETNAAIVRAREGDPSGSHPERVTDATARFRTVPDTRKIGRKRVVSDPFHRLRLRLPPARLDAPAFWPRGR